MKEKKPTEIQKMYTNIPKTYEIINHLITLGLDIILRKRAAALAACGNKGNWVDLCTGTGEMGANLCRLAPKGTKVFAVDFSEEMILAAKMKPEAKQISFIISDIKTLPFPDNHFDVITMSFATRNINISRKILTESFAEYYRVLKRGGRFVSLETSRPSSKFIGNCFNLYIKIITGLIGSTISGEKSAYAYLAKSISEFYPPDELANIMENAGFEKVLYKRYMFGSTAIHQAFKI